MKIWFSKVSSWTKKEVKSHHVYITCFFNMIKNVLKKTFCCVALAYMENQLPYTRHTPTEARRASFYKWGFTKERYRNCFSHHWEASRHLQGYKLRGTQHCSSHTDVNSAVNTAKPLCKVTQQQIKQEPGNFF